MRPSETQDRFAKCYFCISFTSTLNKMNFHFVFDFFFWLLFLFAPFVVAVRLFGVCHRHAKSYSPIGIISDNESDDDKPHSCNLCSTLYSLSKLLTCYCYWCVLWFDRFDCQQKIEQILAFFRRWKMFFSSFSLLADWRHWFHIKRHKNYDNNSMNFVRRMIPFYFYRHFSFMAI